MDRDTYWERLSRRRISRRRLLTQATGGGLGLAATGAVACGRSSGNGRPAASKSAPAPGQPARGGYLNHLLPYSALNIDPATTDDSTGYTFIEEDWYEPFVRISYTPSPDWRIANKVIPWLTDHYEQVDPTTYTFHVRPDVKFHSGDPLTAEDVLFSYNRMKDPAGKPNPAVASYLAGLDHIEAPDDSTIRLTSKRPDADFLTYLTNQRVVIVSKRFVEGGGAITKTALGTGPFKLMSYQHDSNALALRFDGYWQKGRPYLDGIKMVLKVDDSTQSAAFSVGDTDILVTHDQKAADPILKANPKAVAEPFAIEENQGVTFNQTKPPFSDARVRMAVHLVLDRQAADKAVNFGGGVIDGPIVVGGKTGWAIPLDELLKRPGYRQPKGQDIADAKRLMSEAGFANGFKTTIGFSSVIAYASNYAEVIQAQLKQIGIDGTLMAADNATWIQRRVKPDYDLAVVSEASLATPGTAAYTSFYSTGVYAKPSGLNDPELDRLIDTQAQEFDSAKRGALFQQIERMILDKAYKAPVSSPTSIRLNQPWIHDWVDNRSARQTVMNPDAIWMSLDQAPANRRQPS